MKRLLFTGVFIFGMIGYFSCKTSSAGTKGTSATTADNSRNALDWDGIYRGVVPCADCEGIQTTIYLNKDLNYRLDIKYLGKPDNAKSYSGTFTWNEQGNMITLKDLGNSGPPNRYLVGENTLTQLDRKGNKITGNLASKYILSKESYTIVEKYWKLTELYGQPVAVDSTFRKEPHIIFKLQDSRYTGNGGCNSFSGTYTLESGNRIKISNAISTQMACANMDIESKFLQALQAADNFNIAGDMLVLNKAKMAPLARFKMAYMK